MTRPLDAVADGGTRARWTTTLVDLAALILSMFVLLLATRSPEISRAPATFDSNAPGADARPILEPVGPAATAGAGLALSWLRQQLRAAGLDAQVSARAARDGVVLELTEPFARSLTEPTGPNTDGVRSLTALLGRLAPDLRSVTLIYAGSGVAHLEDDLRRAGLSAARLAEAGLRPYPEPVVAPTPPPDHPAVELRLVVEQP